LRLKDRFVQESATGDGPVDAVFNSIDRALKTSYKVESYQVRSVTSGRQAMGEIQVRIRDGERTHIGRGISTDIIEASAKAYLQAVNLLESEKKEVKNKQTEDALVNVV
jgi:2-isopropylmalate synthase